MGLHRLVQRMQQMSSAIWGRLGEYPWRGQTLCPILHFTQCCASHATRQATESCLLWLQPPDLREGDRDGHNIAARLHAVEKHLRKNPLQGGTFYDKLQRSTYAPSIALTRILY